MDYEHFLHVIGNAPAFGWARTITVEEHPEAKGVGGVRGLTVLRCVDIAPDRVHRVEFTAPLDPPEPDLVVCGG